MMKLVSKNAWFLLGLAVVMVPSTGFSEKTKASTGDTPPIQVKKLLKDARCSSQAAELIKGWGASEEWIRSPGDLDKGKVFSSPTSRVGTWVQLAFYPNGSVEVRRVSNQATILAGWKAQDCTPWLNPSASSNTESSVDARFRDNDLQKIVDDKGSALIYEWSPHMTLSVRGFAGAQKLAQKLNVTFVPVLDPAADIDAAKKAAAANSIPETALRRDATLELAMRGMHIHYPTSIVVSRGHISKLYPGLWVSLDAYEKFVKGNLQ